MREKEKWNNLSQLIKNHKINITKAQSIKDGIRINPTTEDDFRKITKVMNQEKMQYHTYELQSEKLLHIFIKGIPEPTDPKEVEEDLKDRLQPS